MKEKYNKRLLCAIILLTGLLAVGCGQSSVAVSPVPSPTATPMPTPTPVPIQTVRFSASGDNLIHGSIYLQARSEGGYDFAPLYENISYFYDDFDLNFINQETLVNDELTASTYPCFSTPGELGKAAYDVGFRLFGGANNHSYDKGAAGIDATHRFWQEMPDDALYFGWYNPDSEVAVGEIPIYEKNGITFACLAYTDSTNGLPTPVSSSLRIIYTKEEALIQDQIKQAATLADVVLVSVHWGIEDSHTVTEAQRTLAQKMADWGAGIIIGTHPHVIQSLEVLTTSDGREVPCAYSLGNFVSAQSKPDQLLGYILTCTITKIGDEPGRVSELAAVPTITSYGSGYSNIRVWLWKDYPAELLQKHGVRSNYSYFDETYIRSVFEEYIDAEYLQLNRADTAA